MILRLGDLKSEVGEWQRTLLRLGIGCVVDNGFGPQTLTATKIFQQGQGIVEDGEVGDITRAHAAKVLAAPLAHKSPNCLGSLVLAVAISQIGVKEESGNRGAGIAKYWTATSYPEGMTNREPWCAAFACWCVFQALGDLLTNRGRPQSASCEGWLEWAKTRSDLVQILSPSVTVPRAGDLAVYDFGTGHAQHIGVVEMFFSGRSPYFTAIEGNTDSNGGREGIEVARRPRYASAVKAFIRFKGIAPDQSRVEVDL